MEGACVERARCAVLGEAVTGAGAAKTGPKRLGLTSLPTGVVADEKDPVTVGA